MAGYTQENRLIQVITPLGEDALLLQGFNGVERISGLFSFHLRMHSENRSLSFDSVIGKNATIRMILPDRSERYINGVFSSFSQGGYSPTFAYYEATLVPWLWLLTRTHDCRIFQNQTVPDIIQTIFQEHGFSDFENRLHGSYPQREYCVQYRESYFNFVSRLMEEEGIFYFFEHEKDKHKLILADQSGEFKPCVHQPEVSYESLTGEHETEQVVTVFGYTQKVVTGKYETNDFNFEQPGVSLVSSLDGKDERKYELYDYPGEYGTVGEGERLVGIRMQERDSEQIAVNGASTCRGLVTGYRLKLKDHYRKDLNREYVLTSIQHSAEAGTNYRSSETDAAVDLHYGNTFEAIPHPSFFRPARTTPVPRVQGNQTAIVVGPAGEEIFTDKYGRVKVQFHWDRDGKYNENSSCWVRVSQGWAGKGWGAVFIPRIGQEVIVDFLEGDPDRPIIIGCVYNAASMPPYALPDEKTKSTVKSDSYKGTGFNEIRFEDKAGSEQIFINAQHDEDLRVGNIKKEFIGTDSHLIIINDKYEKIGGDNHLQIQGDQNENITATFSRTIGQNSMEKIGGRKAVEAGSEIHLKAQANIMAESGVTLTIKAGASFITLGPAGIFISGPMVMINSGGAPGMGSGAQPDAAKEALEAAKAKAGEKAEQMKPKPPRVPAVYSPAALALKQAAVDGAPFCDH